MKTFKQYIEEVKEPTGGLKKACWTGYTAVGMKMKGGRKVPNCVPEEVELEEGSYMDTVKKRIAGRNAEKYSQYSKADKEQDRPVSSKLYAKMAKNQKKLSEDGMGVGAMSAAPTNTVGSGKIAGSGGQGGEPGVSKKRNPVMSFFKRKQPKM